MKSFCNNYSLKTLLRQPICYKKFEKPTSMDLILPNTTDSFQTLFVIEKAV